jgi:hypothetical protein
MGIAAVALAAFEGHLSYDFKPRFPVCDLRRLQGERIL